MKKSKIFQFSFIGLIIAQVFQSMELIMGKLPAYIPALTAKVHKHLAFFPVIGFNELLFMLLNLVLIIGLFIMAAFIFLEAEWARTIVVIIAVIEILIGLFPILNAIYFSQYFPGIISAGGLIVFGILIFATASSYPEKEPDEES
jgi:hypothetical protein